MANQLMTLLAVLLGAVTSYAAGALNERVRHRRDQVQRRAERKLDVYVAYLDDVKTMRSIARRMLGDSGLDPKLPIALSKDEGLPLLAEAEAHRSISAERVLLLGPKEVVEALRKVNQALWRIEWFARGLITEPSHDAWTHAKQEFEVAINAFRESVRRDLRVSDDLAADLGNV
ncbi:hypothetical protein [Dactylosporangium sp. NPDC051541]|uniref:hypothetical protein n=1 Tax=Dactylosporangium sp. NPDC051541 TaxID=3363977 RepID=UPI0037A00A2A